MTLVPGTNVSVTFLSFAGDHPDIYDATPQGTSHLASVNAGNANLNGLCVGLKGVNGAFLSLLSLTQKRANLSPQLGCVPANYDDYQDRHLKLLAQADAGGTPWQRYANTDPCAFSFVNPTRISPASGYTEGVCFVDVFDPKLCPHANPLNFAMLYVAPPFDQNYQTKAAFLVAIEELAGNIVKTVAAYNALAASQNLPAIATIRNTLYSSGFYNQVLNASHDEIARAIFLGYVGQLSLTPHSGILELQFPVGDPARNQDHPLFAAVQQDLVQNQLQAYRIPALVGGGSMPIEEGRIDEDPPLARQEPVPVEPQGEDIATLTQAKTTLTNAATALEALTLQFDALLSQNAAIPPSIADQVFLGNGNGYDSTSAALNPVDYNRLLPDDIRLDPGPTKDAVKRTKTAADRLLTMKQGVDSARTLNELKRFRDGALRYAANARIDANDALNQANTAGEKNAANLADTTANQADATAKAIEAYVKEQDTLQHVFKDLQGKLLLRTKVGIFATAAAVVTGTVLGILGGLNLFGNGSAPPKAPKNQDLDQDGLADGMPVAVDVLAVNKALDPEFDPTLVQSVDLVGNTPNSGWSVANNIVTYTPSAKPSSGTTVTISYKLLYNDPTIPLSTPTDLTITFVNIATDLVANTATFTLPPRAFLLNPNDAWKLDPITNTVTYTPPADLTSATAQQTYQLGKTLPKNTANLIALLPVKSINLSKAASLTDATSTSLPAPGTASWTLFDSAGTAVTTTGPWTLQDVNKVPTITFTPNSAAPPQPNSTQNVSFGLQKNGITQKAQADITFAAGPVSTVQDVPFLAPNRTAPATVTIPNVTNITLGSPTTTEGTWTINGSNVTFQSDPAFQAKVNEGAQATNTYTAPGYTGTITLTFPLNLQIDGASRVDPTVINFAARNPKIQKTLTDITFNNFYPGQVRSASGRWEYYLPPGPALQIASDKGLYNMTFEGDPTVYTANLQVVFEKTFKAYDFTEDVPRTQLPGPLSFDIGRYCYFPSPSKFASLSLVPGGDSRFWSYDPAANKTSVTLLTDNPPTQSTYALTYTVSDDSTKPLTSTATITVRLTMMRRMPMAADFLLAKDVWSPARVQPSAGMDVLKNCVSFYGIDESSVTLTGPVDLNADYAAPAAYGVNDPHGQRKSLRIPNEGSWLVDDSGKIGFVAETGLTTPPTPVGFQFRDKKGNLSNPAVIIIHSALNDAMTGIPHSLQILSDTAFWASFQQHVIWWKPALTADQFVATASLFAGLTHAAGMVGTCPLSDLEFDAAHSAWFNAGHHWLEPSGKEDPAALFALCRKLVDQATQGTNLPLRARYWRLALMARMLCYPTPTPNPS